jgi:hypothetical protein
MLDTYISWAKHPEYKSCTTLLANQAARINAFLRQCRAWNATSLCLQGNHETKNYPVVVSRLFLHILFNILYMLD